MPLEWALQSTMPSTANSSSDQPLAWALPPGMRATRATRALERLYHERPHAALSEAGVEAALADAGSHVKRVTEHRMRDSLAAAVLLHTQVDAALVRRYALAPRV